MTFLAFNKLAKDETQVRSGTLQKGKRSLLTVDGCRHPLTCRRQCRPYPDPVINTAIDYVGCVEHSVTNPQA
jgi:hypothetical protein